MQEAIQKLREFHTKHNFPLDCKMSRTESINYLLKAIASELTVISERLEVVLHSVKDQRIHRAHLMTEELGETIQAMANDDEIALLDGLGDLLFVTIGTGETFGLPTEQALLEVCNSNLTKAVRDPNDVRLRNKGASFIPPDMKKVLDDWKIKNDTT